MDFALDDSVGFLINRTAVHLKRALTREFRANGQTVTAEQWALLNRVWEQEGLSQVRLAELTFKDKPNVTRMVEVLERDGLIERRQDEGDRRTYRIHATEEGLRLRDELVPLAMAVLDRALAGVAEDDIERLKRVLEQMDRNMEAL
ncbi:MarR family winged helix-turn-helix transcriptional regulator [Nonomuraea africana]|uniref:DNA-binding MarR family transcriptional regulator n=1 Tax=Nonomuraea africana TaxID=46171 RepID=A0ABR9KHQ9_9ACTN|nr:MarR family transcriptional regulator [Nonomuraea africana]MBE1561545.1 DNA-binding MarR family transcriptional regulator [Nonomuraea africana]